MLAKTHPLAQVNGVDNAILLESEQLGQLFMQGAGAGRYPTASAIMGDLDKCTFWNPQPPLWEGPDAVVLPPAGNRLILSDQAWHSLLPYLEVGDHYVYLSDHLPSNEPWLDWVYLEEV